ncbi:1-acylglycerol-3-phosphate O-acyltransferase PNPLA3 [Sesamum alatum]|uniref:Patatin n=1 Tax=Sesamum alatum TaxID=300844 RepID=A0AAE1Y791_9LAMI|nr:1-acylglycerol-3-phosphate O-acyltransferase PNPLA3 [Sesamum alatum]
MATKRKAFVSMFSMAPSTNQATTTLFSAKPMMASSPSSSLFLHPTAAAKAAVPFRSLSFSTKATPPQHQSVTPPPPQEKRSLAVATGELFLGIASRILKRGGSIVNGGEGSEMRGVEMFAEEEEGEWLWRRRRKERIAAVVEDPVQPEVVWEQRVKDVEAERRRKAVSSPGFSFSAAGLLFPYHLGVAQLLIEKGYIKETTPLAGSSAGAIVCAVIASGASMQEALEATKILAEDCRTRGTAFRLGAVLRDILDKFLPDDAHIRSSGRVRVAVTQILWRPRGLLVDQFDSKEDLINAVFTSSFIPGYLAPRPATMFRNRLCIDGGLTLFMPPTSAAETVRVCAFPATQLGLQGIGISPDLNPENRATPRELFNWALEPAADDILDKLFELGYLDAAVWAEDNPVEKIVRDNGSYSENSPTQ